MIQNESEMIVFLVVGTNQKERCLHFSSIAEGLIAEYCASNGFQARVVKPLYKGVSYAPAGNLAYPALKSHSLVSKMRRVLDETSCLYARHCHSNALSDRCFNGIACEQQSFGPQMSTC